MSKEQLDKSTAGSETFGGLLTDFDISAGSFGVIVDAHLTIHANVELESPRTGAAIWDIDMPLAAARLLRDQLTAYIGSCDEQTAVWEEAKDFAFRNG